MTETPSPQRSITIYIDPSGQVGRYSFALTAPSARYPWLMESGDLRSASKASKGRLSDEAGREPVPLLLVDASSVGPQRPSTRIRGAAPRELRGVRSLPHSRAIASLLLDCSSIGIAEGAVVVVDPDVMSKSRFLEEVSDILRPQGIRVSTTIEGWELRISPSAGGFQAMALPPAPEPERTGAVT